MIGSASNKYGVPAFPGWIRLGILAVALIAVPLASFFAYRAFQHLAREKACRAMKQIFAALEMYSQASDGNYYPMRSAQPGAFLPDMDEWAMLYDGKTQFEQAYGALTGSGRRPLCYLGYAFHRFNEALAQELLDELERNPERLRGGGTLLQEQPWIDPSSPEAGIPHPLRKGVERCFFGECEYFAICGINPCDGYVKEGIPILWQMPRQEGDSVLVLYLNGSIEWQKYPGKFPMSPLFINRLRGLMGLPQDPGFTMDTPILPVVRKILDAGSRKPGWGVGSLVHFEVDPSVSFRNAAGYRIAFTGAELVLFPEQAEASSIPSDALFEPPYGLPYLTNQYMGAGMGYHWYGEMDYFYLLMLRDNFSLTGGDSLYPRQSRIV